MIHLVNRVPLLSNTKTSSRLIKRRLTKEGLVYIERYFNEFRSLHSAGKCRTSALDDYAKRLERLNVAEVFPNDPPDLLSSLLRILVQEDLHNVALLGLEC